MMRNTLTGELRPMYIEAQQSGKLAIDNACPVLYRFMHDEHIEEFLNAGKIRISTISQCKSHRVKKRRDVSECTYQYELQWRDTVNDALITVGENAFVLCSSLTQAAVHEPAHVSCLELHHWQSLVLEIGEQLRQMGYPIAEIFTGPCNYAVKKRVINMWPKEFREILTPDGNVDTLEFGKLLAKFGREALYMTKDFRFVDEHEYRFLWLSDEKISVNHVDITIPHPERFGCKVPAIGKTYESE